MLSALLVSTACQPRHEDQKIPPPTANAEQESQPREIRLPAEASAAPPAASRRSGNQALAAMSREGASAFVEVLLAIPDPPPIPMLHAYPNAVEGDALVLQIVSTTLRPTKVGPGSYGFLNEPRAHPYDAIVMPVRLTSRAATPLTMTLGRGPGCSTCSAELCAPSGARA